VSGGVQRRTQVLKDEPGAAGRLAGLKNPAYGRQAATTHTASRSADRVIGVPGGVFPGGVLSEGVRL